MKLFALVQMQSGQPNIDPVATPYFGFSLCDQIGNWGTYLISGTSSQLAAINALPQVFGICSVTESGTVKWAELDNTVSSTIRTKLNTWITNNHPAWPQIPATATYRQILNALYQKFNSNFDLNGIDVADS